MTAEYVREAKQLMVVLDNGETHTHHNVSEVAAHAMFAAPSMELHYKKYIQNIYLKIERKDRECPN